MVLQGGILVMLMVREDRCFLARSMMASVIDSNYIVDLTGHLLLCICSAAPCMCDFVSRRLGPPKIISIVKYSIVAATLQPESYNF